MPEVTQGQCQICKHWEGLVFVRDNVQVIREKCQSPTWVSGEIKRGDKVTECPDFEERK